MKADTRSEALDVDGVLMCDGKRLWLPSPDLCRILRKRAGLTQEELGACVPASRTSISRWERGQRIPRGLFFERYLELLDRLEAELAGATPKGEDHGQVAEAPRI